MAEFNLERIRFRWKSDWLLSTKYVKDDIVYFEGKAYVCLIGHTSGGTNIYSDLNLAAPNTRWVLMFDGNQWRGNHGLNVIYSRGDIVKYKGYIYQCITEHQATNIVAQALIADIEKWTIVATTYNWLNTWTPTVDAVGATPAVTQYYDLGDIVIYNGITYACIEKHIAANSYYLGLEYDDTLPTQPAVLGEELKAILIEMLDTMEEITDKICVNVAYTIAEGPLTGMNPKNFSAFDDIRTQIDGLKIDLDDMMSINTKLV